jgi:hypothetical protein
MLLTSRLKCRSRSFSRVASTIPNRAPKLQPPTIYSHAHLLILSPPTPFSLYSHSQTTLFYTKQQQQQQHGTRSPAFDNYYSFPKRKTSSCVQHDKINNTKQSTAFWIFTLDSSMEKRSFSKTQDEVLRPSLVTLDTIASSL